MHGPVTVSDLAASALCVCIAWGDSGMLRGQYGVHLYQEIFTKYYLYAILSFLCPVRMEAPRRMTTVGMPYQYQPSGRKGAEKEKKEVKSATAFTDQPVRITILHYRVHNHTEHLSLHANCTLKKKKKQNAAKKATRRRGCTPVTSPSRPPPIWRYPLLAFRCVDQTALTAFSVPADFDKPALIDARRR